MAQDEQILGAAARKKVSAFVALMTRLRAEGAALGPASLAEKILEESGYRDALAGEATMEAEGRMAEPGRAAIARSKALGLWDAYAEIDALIVPDDLITALRRQAPEAEAGFLEAAPSYRRNVLRWIAAAKRPATRAQRIAQVARLAAEGGRVPQM